MRGRYAAAGLAALLAFSAAPVRADGVLSTQADCGGDAFSSAQVIERRPPRRGPITAIPETLCADLAPQRPGSGIEIQAYPLVGPENGAGRYGAPYQGRLR